MKIATHPMVRISIKVHLSTSRPADQWQNLFELARRAFPLHLGCFFRDLIPKVPIRVLPSPEYKLGIVLGGFRNSFFDIMVDGSFDRAHEASPHINTASTESQSASKSVAVCETTASDVWDISKRLTGSRQQNEVGDVRLADMTSTFEAVDRKEIDPKLDCCESVSDCCAFVQNLTTSTLDFCDHLFYLNVACGLHDLDALVDDYLGVC